MPTPMPTGFLSFYNARTKQLLHTFKAKFTAPVLPAFTVRGCQGWAAPRGLPGLGFSDLSPSPPSLCQPPLTSNPRPVCPQVWCGSFQVTSGLQVPSAVKCLQKRNSTASSSNASLA